ncbi:MAG: DUF4097 family beta strand repeat-containing protein [Lachnospiraceae bacterium]|nr:DUF4097 family beta strand repeat-containing protein [Lachnospiraceae bacterium]
MKPILKICMMISSVLFAAGIACIGIGIAMGVTPAQLVHAGHYPGSSLIRSGLDEITSEVPLLPELSGISEDVPDDLPDRLDETENLSGTNSSGAEEYYEFQNIQELELELSLCSLNIDRHDKDFIAVEADNVQNYFRCRQEGDTLSLKDDRPHSARQNSRKNELRLTLYLPDQIFREVSVEMEVGEILLDALAADEVEITNGVGNITIGTLKGADLSVHTGVGEFLADRIQADREADIRVDTGNITLAQFDGNSLELECAVGNAEVTAAGSELDYNYTLDAALGSIFLNSRQQNNYGHDHDSHDDWEHHLDIHHGADRRISINCSLGNATLNFMEE